MDVLHGLNEAQRQAVQAVHGPVLVLAGPGSGKTRVLTHRVAYLAGPVGVDPYHIFTVTFTNKAAREMKSRLETLLGPGVERLTVGTFHATCARLLRREADFLPVSRDYQIFDDDDQVNLVAQIVKEMNLDDKRYRPRALLSTISRAKAELITPDRFERSSYWLEIAGRVYARYTELLCASNALDFDDLLLQTVLLFREQPAVLARYQHRYQFLLADEFQDTNIAQYELLKLLAGGQRNLFVVGDEDQSIYRFRGADLRNVIRFREDYPDAQVILLEQNYRSTQVILDVANAVIARNPNRTPKHLQTRRRGGGRIKLAEAYNEQEEGSYVAREIQRLVSQGVCRPGDCAVMYRTNAQSRPIEDAFVRYGMPYRLVGATRFYARKEVKDVLAYLRLIHNPFDNLSFARIINVPPRGIGQKTLADLGQWAGAAGLPLALAAQRATAGDDGTDGRRPALTGRALAALRTFADLLAGWQRARTEKNVLELLDQVLAESGYASFVRDGSEEGEDRWANIMELRSVAYEYAGLDPQEGLTRFLEEVALVSDVDDLQEQSDVPTLLTVHMAKGLEFATVFIVGLEEGVFPHSRCMDDPEEMAEERRLFYVGVTRAKDRLYLLRTYRRTLYGTEQMNQPSRFLLDIPERLVEGHLVSRAGQPPAPERVPPEGRPPLSRPAAQPGRSAPAPRPPRDQAAGAPAYHAGDRVEHPAFGRGTVISSQIVGSDEEVLVAFEGRGVKKLLASLAPLTRIG
jgi:DNA helicase-2/ATP-dependent DNA helicase PcrA